MVQPAQIAALIDYLELRPELALGHLTRTMEGRSLAKVLWAECATILNAASVNGAQKTADGWRVFYNEYKSRVLKKYKALSSGDSGGGKPRLTNLTPLQNRLRRILGHDVREPLNYAIIKNEYIKHNIKEEMNIANQHKNEYIKHNIKEEMNTANQHKNEYIKNNIMEEMNIADRHIRTVKEECIDTDNDSWCPNGSNNEMEIVEVTPLHINSDNISCGSAESYYDDSPCPITKKRPNYKDMYFKRMCQNAVLERRKHNQDIRLRQKEHNMAVKLHHTKLAYMRKEHEEKMKRIQFID